VRVGTGLRGIHLTGIELSDPFSIVVAAGILSSAYTEACSKVYDEWRAASSDEPLRMNPEGIRTSVENAFVETHPTAFLPAACDAHDRDAILSLVMSRDMGNLATYAAALHTLHIQPSESADLSSYCRHLLQVHGMSLACSIETSPGLLGFLSNTVSDCIRRIPARKKGGSREREAALKHLQERISGGISDQLANIVEYLDKDHVNLRSLVVRESVRVT
jgi:hypothetical protein